MTLDPVHFEGIRRLAGRIDHGTDERDHGRFAETVWEEFLDPLTQDGRPILEPIEPQCRRRVDCTGIALADRPFSAVHGLDAGTINPTTFRNGLVVDLAQAAMSASPSDLELHRSRTLVAAVHSNDPTTQVDDRWGRFDEGYSRMRALLAPRVPQFAEGIVHAFALYTAESQHALTHAEEVSELLVLDGPLYPRGLLRWQDLHPDLAALLTDEPQPAAVLERYVDLVETFVERDVPLIGFVKNPASRIITRTVADNGGDAPWTDDTAFYRAALEPRTDDGSGRSTRHNRDTDCLTYTTWFRSRGGVDRPLSVDGDALGVTRSHAPETYEVTFFVCYDPRTDLVYRIESPYAFTRDEAVRRQLTRQVLSSVATTGGPPEAVARADELARIATPEKRSLRLALEDHFETSQDRSYDDHRWTLGDA